MALNFQMWLLLWRNTAACEAPALSCTVTGYCVFHLLLYEGDLFILFFLLDSSKSDDMLQGHPRFPHHRPQWSRFCDGRNFTAVPLVTVSDKYRGLWSSPLQLCLCLLLLGARERSHHLGAATVLIHPH